MILEMLAGDELAPDDPNALRATGFLVRNFKLLSREKWMQDTVEHTSKAFLGVTHRLRPLPRPHVRPDVRRRITTVSGRSSSRTRSASTACRASSTSKKDGLARVYDAKPARADVSVPARRRPHAGQDATDCCPACPRRWAGRFSKIEPVTLPPRAHMLRTGGHS